MILKLVKYGAVIAAVGIVLFIGRKSWLISVICPRCLQHGYLEIEEIYGLPVYQSLELAQDPGGITSPAIFSPGFPSARPSLYIDIASRPCIHRFKKGGFGVTTIKYTADGCFPEWGKYTARISAMEALYAVWSKYRDRQLAVETLRLIDRCYPVAEDDRNFMKDRFPGIYSGDQWLTENGDNMAAVEIFRQLPSARSAREWRALLHVAGRVMETDHAH